MQSIVKWFSNERGYGFIKYKDDQDVFIHYSAIVSDDDYKTLIPGEFVEFDLVRTEDGYKAKNVKSLKEEI